MGEHHRQRPLRGVARLAWHGGEMDVHVDQARHQGHAARVDLAGAGGHAHRGPRTDDGDALALDQDRLVGEPLRPRHRQHIGTHNGGHLLGLDGDRQEQGEKGKKQA